jgi:hypothetical protein
MKKISPIKTRFVQTPRGSATHWAYGSFKKKAFLEISGNGITVAWDIGETPRLLSWKSGNWSSTAKRFISNFDTRYPEGGDGQSYLTLLHTSWPARVRAALESVDEWTNSEYRAWLRAK